MATDRAAWTQSGTLHLSNGPSPVWTHPSRPGWVYIGDDPWVDEDQRMWTLATTLTQYAEFVEVPA